MARALRLAVAAVLAGASVAAAQARAGGEFQVNTYTTGFQTWFDQTLGSTARPRR